MCRSFPDRIGRRLHCEFILLKILDFVCSLRAALEALKPSVWPAEKPD
jgi:hypothetical protein